MSLTHVEREPRNQEAHTLLIALPRTASEVEAVPFLCAQEEGIGWRTQSIVSATFSLSLGCHEGSSRELTFIKN